MKSAKLAGYLLGAALLVLAAGGNASAREAELVVDAAQAGDGFVSFNNTAAIPGPAPGFPDFADVTPFWRAAGVDLVRTYDWPARLDTIDSPESLFPRWAADPTDPASYNFAAVDAWIASTRAAGARPVFTFMTNVPHNKLPAADVAKYGVVVEHIVRHLVEGWGGGVPRAVEYFDFGDQPDFGRLHFDGEPDQFYAMYEAFARAVKRVDPALKVGGPGLAFPLNEGSPYREPFLAWVRERNLPLDYFSYIWFSDASGDPMDMTVVANRMRDVLDRAGFDQTELFAISWNYTGIPTARFTPAEAAAFQAAATIYSQEAPIDRAFIFRGDTGTDPHYEMTDPASIFAAAGDPGARGNSFIFAGQTMAGQRLSATGGDHRGLAITASRDDAGQVVRVLIANYAASEAHLAPRASDVFTFTVPIGPSRTEMRFQQPPQRDDLRSQGFDSYRLTLNGLPWASGDLRIDRYRIDAGHTGQLVDSRVVSAASPVLEGPLAAPAVEYIEIRPVAAAQGGN